MTLFIEAFFVCSPTRINDNQINEEEINRRRALRVIAGICHSIGDFLFGHFRDVIETRTFVGIELLQDLVGADTFRFSKTIDQRLETFDFECLSK